MLSTTYSALLQGLAPIKITIEVALTQGLPTLQIVGLPSKMVDESKERITAALAACGIKPKAQRTVVNLAPADVHKTTSALELAITAGLLQAYEKIPPIHPKTMLFGELSLTGQLKSIKGALPLVLGAKQLGFTTVFLPTQNATEVQLISGITIFPVTNLQEFILYQQQKQPLSALQNTSFTSFTQDKIRDTPLLFENVIGQKIAKRALQICAAGGHNIFLVGPPGTGKSILAEATTALLPPLSEAEALEVFSLHSIAGKLPTTELTAQRPFRKIHHTISQIGLVGGGSQLVPGEISLAHRGVLFMDELPEFPRHIIEALRQPLESKTITLSRASGTVQYSTDFTLIAAGNPCPCGYLGSQKKACRCSQFEIMRYKNKLSGPILDRIDLHVWVEKNETTAVFAKNIDSQEIVKMRENVLQARETQQQRYQTLGNYTNASLPFTELAQHCELTLEGERVLYRAQTRLQLSLRAAHKVLRVARTIADLAGEKNITVQSLTEALQYRPQESNQLSN